MGLGRTATVGFADENGNWVPVTPDNPLPTSGDGSSGGGGWTPPAGTNGQVLKYDASGNLAPGTDNNTTYTVISGAEITAGTATTARAISGATAKLIVDAATPAEAQLVPAVGTEGQVLKVTAGVPAWAADANTTYTAASQAEAENAASTTARLFTGQRVAQAIAANATITALATRITALEAAMETAIQGDGTITALVAKTQAEYDGLTPDATTQYTITEA